MLFLTEIDVAKEKVSEAEDLQLEVMEALETKEIELPKLKNKFEEEGKKFQEFKKQKEESTTAIKKDITELTIQRNNIFKGIDSQWSSHYEKIFAARNGLAVVSINHAACQGCYQQILLQTSIEVKMGKKIHLCQHCSRILYFLSEQETEQVVSE